MKKSLILYLALLTGATIPAHTEANLKTLASCEAKIKKAVSIPLKLSAAAACLMALEIGGNICVNYNRAMKGLTPLVDDTLGRLLYLKYGSKARLLALLSVFPAVAGIIHYGKSAVEDTADLFFSF